MLDPEMCKSVYCLYNNGMPKREISRRLKISRNTVRHIIKAKGNLSRVKRADTIVIDEDVLRDLYAKCHGWRQRIHEMLTEQGVEISYSALTRKIRHMNFEEDDKRCSRVDDKPGEEIQHDTSKYKIRVGNVLMVVIASLLYFRFSKVRYLKFYRSFDRFRMKCFLYEALMYFGFTAKNSIIDNTNLAVLSGSGPDAVIHPEMSAFSRQFGFTFVPHNLNHSDRKAGEERGFYTTETNFFPGREPFASMEDLNAQAFEWSTEKMASRPLTKKRIIPREMFEIEKPYLIKVPKHLPRPYRVHERAIDQYGYVAFGGNFFWVPGTDRFPVSVVEFSDSIQIYSDRKMLVEHTLPAEDTKNARIGEIADTGHELPRNQKRPTEGQEVELRAVDEAVGKYLNFALKRCPRRHQFLIKLYSIYRNTPRQVFIDSIARAMKYRILEITIIERIILYTARSLEVELPEPSINGEYESRESYLEGKTSEKPDLSQYDSQNFNDPEDDKEEC